MNKDSCNNTHDIRVLDNENPSFLKDIRSKFSGIDKRNLVLNIMALLLLTSIGVLTRFLVAYYYKVNFPDDILVQTDIWIRDIAFNPQNFQFHGFSDFSYYYVKWTEAWYDGNWYPYEWGDRFSTPLLNYSYPPFFLYLITIFWRPGMNYIWIAFPLVLTDSLCAGMVYLILRHFFRKKNSLAVPLFGGFLLVLAPLNIIYNGAYWLNTGPVTLFTLISVFFILRKKWWQSFFWLAIATLSKQDALFLIYPIFLTMFGMKLSDRSLKKALFESIAIGILYLFILIIGSFPFLIISPQYYIMHNAVPGKMLSLDTFVEDTEIKCITFSLAVMQIGIRGLLLDLIAFGINSMLLFYLSVTILTTVLFYRSFKDKLTDVGFIELITCYLILSHLFLTRGIFKFYTPYFTPFYLIAFMVSILKLSENKIIFGFNMLMIAIGFMISNLAILLIFRKAFPLIVALIVILIGFSALIRKIIEYRKSRENPPQYTN